MILRRIKRVTMPRGAASQVACGRLSEVSILWTGVIRTAQASIAFGASYAHLRRIKCVPMSRGAASEDGYQK